MSHLLITRFSALGDVAMTVPVIAALAKERPGLSITVVSRPYAKALFDGLAPNVGFLAIDPRAPRYRGLAGLNRLYQDLAALRPDAYCDLHDVLRTKFLRLRFRLAGLPVSVVGKNRRLRRRLTRPADKDLTPLPTAFERYAKALGIAPPTATRPPLRGTREASIGLAPFAAHKGKILPLETTEALIALLLKERPSLRIYLFGGGKEEKATFSRWRDIYNNVSLAADTCHGLADEMELMRRLRCLVSMDSANMHLASLAATPVVSVWGATHPLAGFLGWGQSLDDCVQLPLPCRPCSIYGNRPCRRAPDAPAPPCLAGITARQIADAIARHL